MWFENDNRLPQTRLAVVSYVIVGLMGLLLLGFWKLQISNSDRYAQLAERNRVRTIPIIAPRGSMLDRHGRVIVDNYPSFSVLLLRDDPAQALRLLPQIAEGLGVTLDDLKQQWDAAKFLPHFQPIVIKPQATPADIDFIESHRSDLPMLEMLMVHRRRYPRGDFMAHVSGYVGEVSAEQISASNDKYRPGDIVGKDGLEKEYNDVLMGVDGTRRVVVNSVGREVGHLAQTEAIPGKPIRLTIDYDLEAVAEQDLAGKRGAVVALDPQTGEVLAMVSQPSYDPNDFAVRISKQEWQQLNSDPERPLLNRAIQAQLAPGSVFKIFMTTAMLESKAISPDFKVFCLGYAEFYGRTFHDAEKGGHGLMDLHNAIVHSCDVYFYNVGQRLGIDRISYYAMKLGLGHKTGVDLPGEETGLVPSEEWKERVFHQKWYAGETISVSIGQGATMVTPIQLAYTIGGIAMGGVFRQPHLVAGERAPEIDFPISESTTDFLTQAMWGVVNEGGTAGASKLPGIEFCGKTGTAQVIGQENKHLAGKGTQTKNNGWFVGFEPRRNPEIVVAVLVQAGGYGSDSAAPIARDIVKAYWTQRHGPPEQQLTTQANPAGKAPLAAFSSLGTQQAAKSAMPAPGVESVSENAAR